MTRPNGRKSARAKLVVITPVPVRASRPRPRARKLRNNRSSGNALSVYLQSIQNPFHVSPPLLGFGSFSPVGSDAAWSRTYGPSLAATSTCFCATFTPAIFASTAGTLGWQVFSNAPNTGTTVFDATASPVQYTSPVDYARLATIASTSRVVTAGLRVHVRYPMTSSPGRLFAIPLFDNYTNIASRSYLNLANLAEAHPIVIDGSGVASAEVRFKPSDLTDMNFFTPFGSFPTNYPLSSLLVVGIGWTPGSFSVDIETLAHFEYHSGIAPSSDTYDQSTVSMVIPIERLAAAVRPIPAFAGKLSMIAEDAAYQRIIGLSSNSARAGRTSLHSSSMPSSSSSSSSTAGMGGTSEDSYINTAFRAGGQAALSVSQQAIAIANERGYLEAGRDYVAGRAVDAAAGLVAGAAGLVLVNQRHRIGG